MARDLEKRGLSRKFAHFVLFCPIKKAFSLTSCVFWITGICLDHEATRYFDVSVSPASVTGVEQWMNFVHTFFFFFHLLCQPLPLSSVYSSAVFTDLTCQTKSKCFQNLQSYSRLDCVLCNRGYEVRGLFVLSGLRVS